MKNIVISLLMIITSLQVVGQRPSYKFSIKVAIDKETVDSFGGMERIKPRLKEMFDTINSRFNNNSFYALYDFAVDWNAVYIYDGASRPEVQKKHPFHNYLVVIDGLHNYEEEGGGGWNGGTTQAIYHYRGSTANKIANPFDKQATDGIVHEFGHARGVPDIYSMSVDSAKNPVSKEKFRPVHSIMNECFNVTVWDTYSINLINLSGDRIIDIDSLILPCFPLRLDIKVMQPDGRLIKNALVRFYPVKWYSYSVLDTVIQQGRTNKKGIYTCTENPFQPGKAGIDYGMNCNNLLVEVNKGNKKTYTWLPLYDFQNAFFDGKNRYELVLTLN
jgi:hypothetical protein